MGLRKAVGGGDTFLIGCIENSGERHNPFSAIDVNAFRTTNFRSLPGMPGAKFHRNTRRESTTRILSTIPWELSVNIKKTVALFP